MAGPVIRASNHEFFLARAEEARAQADAATLDHVRERCLRSEAAWMVLADKAERTQRMRVAEEKRKAAIAAATVNDDTDQEDGPEGPQPAAEAAKTIP